LYYLYAIRSIQWLVQSIPQRVCEMVPDKADEIFALKYQSSIAELCTITITLIYHFHYWVLVNLYNHSLTDITITKTRLHRFCDAIQYLKCDDYLLSWFCSLCDWRRRVIFNVKVHLIHLWSMCRIYWSRNFSNSVQSATSYRLIKTI